MNFIQGMLILIVCGAVVAQDAVASIAFYKGREGRKNQAFRLVRLAIGVTIMTVVFNLVGG